MKVYNKVIIDICSGKVVYEDSYEYSGEVSLAKGGGGGGSGSGEVDYPVYMKEVQADWLAGGESDGTGLVSLTAGNDITSLLDVAIGNSPFATASAYDPSSEISDINSATSAFESNASTKLTELETYIDSISTTSKVESELSQFDAGMANINAVNSSAFVVGHQIVAGGLIEAKIQAKTAIAENHSEIQRILMHYKMEAARMSIAASVEEMSKNIKLDKNDALWDLEAFQNGANVMASISGGVPGRKTDDEISDGRAAMGGALSGAAAGAMYGATKGSAVGPGWGTVIGAVIGGIGGMLAN